MKSCVLFKSAAAAVVLLLMYVSLGASSVMVRVDGSATDQNGYGVMGATIYCTQQPSINIQTDIDGNYENLWVPKGSTVSATAPEGFSSSSSQESSQLNSSINRVDFHFTDDSSL